MHPAKTVVPNKSFGSTKNIEPNVLMMKEVMIKAG